MKEGGEPRPLQGPHLSVTLCRPGIWGGTALHSACCWQHSGVFSSRLQMSQRHPALHSHPQALEGGPVPGKTASGRAEVQEGRHCPPHPPAPPSRNLTMSLCVSRQAPEWLSPVQAGCLGVRTTGKEVCVLDSVLVGRGVDSTASDGIADTGQQTPARSPRQGHVEPYPPSHL